MQTLKAEDSGFAHIALILGVLSVLIVAGAATVVVKANHNASIKASVGAGSANTKKNTVSGANAQSNLAPASTATAATSGSAGTTSSATKTGTTTKTSGNATATPTSGQSTTSGTGTQTGTATAQQTPLQVLTDLITNLDNGSQVNITSSAVTVPGPISDAQARPIVFTANGQSYFAYHQGSAPDFSTSAATTANSMAIVKATVVNPALQQGHLNKAGALVDENSMDTLVGYSQGGA